MFLHFLYSKPTKRAINPLITNVPGAKTKALATISEITEPRHAAIVPYTGPNITPAVSTAQSPTLIYPPVGEGTRNTIVITNVKAMKSPVNASFLVVVSIDLFIIYAIVALT